MPNASYNLNINLGNYASIKRAEKIFGELSRNIDATLDDALEETAQKMEKKAAESLSSYGLGGSEVASSVKLVNTGDGITLVASSDHADYVEFGTGIRGAESPHPKPNGWSYDVNEHGDDGWVYKGKDGKFHWTAGTRSRPFMYETWIYGSRIIGSQVNKHIHSLLKGAGL